jgi:hypothetical protein
MEKLTNMRKLTCSLTTTEAKKISKRNSKNISRSEKTKHNLLNLGNSAKAVVREIYIGKCLY